MTDEALIMMPAKWISLPITGGEFRVLAAICQYARLGSEDGCLRSYQSIAETTLLDRDTVKKAIRKLRTLGVIRIEARGGLDGERTTTNRVIPNWQLRVGADAGAISAALELDEAGGAKSPGGLIPSGPGMQDPPVKLSGGSSNSSSPRAGDREPETLADKFADADHRAAYEAYRRSHRMPDAYDAVIRAVHKPISGGPSYDWATIGAALLEMRARQADFGKPFLVACCRRIVASDLPMRGASVGDTIRRGHRAIVTTGAVEFWAVCRDAGLLTAPSREAVEEAVDRCIEQGRITDRAAFLKLFDHVRPWELSTARTTDWAVERVAERMATYQQEVA